MIIYKITNNVNQKVYIGQTIRPLNVRKYQHIYASKTKNHPLYNDIRKYSKDNFSWAILCECESKDELNIVERHYISHYKSKNPEFGYNLTIGGSGPIGYKHTEETKAKFRATRNTKTYKVEDPESNTYIVSSIKHFCKDRNLDRSAMVHVANGKYNHHKGWTCYHVDLKLYHEANSKRRTTEYIKDYEIVSPSGQIITVGSGKEHTLYSFCKEHNLRRSSMSLIALGQMKLHKGWSCKSI